MSVIRALEEIIKTLREDNLEFSRSAELDFQYYAVGLCLSEQTKIKALKRKYVYKCGRYYDSLVLGMLREEWSNSDRVKKYGDSCNENFSHDKFNKLMLRKKTQQSA